MEMTVMEMITSRNDGRQSKKGYRWRNMLPALACALLITAPSTASTSNGLIPLAQLLAQQDDASLFTRALRLSGLWNALETRGRKIVFIPSDEALAREGSAFLLEQVLLTPENRDRLHAVVGTHLITNRFAGNLMTVDSGAQTSVPESTYIRTAASNCLAWTRNERSLRVGPHAVATRILEATDGLLVYVDRLLFSLDSDQRACSQSNG